MLSYLKDLIKHTSGLDIDILKLTGDEDGNIKIEGMDTDKSVVLKGKFAKKIVDLQGTTGLGNLSDLNGFVNFYQERTDVVDIVRNVRTVSAEVKDDDGEIVLDGDGNPTLEAVEENVIEEFHFSRPTPVAKNSYRVIDKRMIPDQYNFLGADWDVVVNPSKQAIDVLAQQASIGFETVFGVRTEDKVLFLTFGDSGSKGEMEFAKDVDGELTKPWVWDIAKVLTILKFSDNADCTLSFLDKGALQVTLDTGLGEYNYIMPAKAR